MINYILESTLIWLTLFVFYKLILQNTRYFRLNRIYLLASLAAGIVLPLIHIPVNRSENIVIYELQTFSLNGQNAISSNETLIANSFNPFTTLLIIIYLIGVGYVVIRFISNLVNIYRLYNSGSKTRFGSYTEIHMAEGINPFSFFSWMFIPNHIRSSGSYDLIKKHELAHIQQWHSLDILYVEMVRIFFWFNPIVGLYKRSLVENHEYLADQSSLKHTERYAYGKLLLSFNAVHPDFYLSNQLNNSIIKNRITMMYKKNADRTSQFRYLFILPLITLLVFLFSCEQQEVANKEDTTEKQELITADSKTDAKDVVFTVVEQMPRFPGCEDIEGSEEDLQKCSNKQLMTYIFKNIKYPEAARKKGVEGTVIASFVVDETGKVTDPKIIKTIGEGCDEEVIKLLNSMNDMDKKWVPGKQRGENVKVKFTLPVKFKLADGEK